MFFTPFAQLFSPLPLKFLYFVFLLVGSIHLSLLQHPVTKNWKNAITPNALFEVTKLYITLSIDPGPIFIINIIILKLHSVRYAFTSPVLSHRPLSHCAKLTKGSQQSLLDSQFNVVPLFHLIVLYERHEDGSGGHCCSTSEPGAEMEREPKRCRERSATCW